MTTAYYKFGPEIDLQYFVTLSTFVKRDLELWQVSWKE